MKKQFLFIVSFFLLIGATAQVRYVKSNATGSNNGTSWANAFTTLQPAIDAVEALGGGEVWVAAGTYKPTTTTDRTISFVMKDKVAIYGGFNGTETQFSQRNTSLNVPFLSGEIGTTSLTDNSHHVVTAGGTVGNTAILDGFRITRGYTDNSDIGGAGFYGQGTSAIIRNCHIYQNQVAVSKVGAGLYFRSGGNAQVINCQVYLNIAATGNGGGIFVLPPSSATIVNTLFYSNEAASGGGVASNGSTSIINCTFSKNKSTGSGSGGAIYVAGGASGLVTVSNSIMWGNLSPTAGREEIFAEFGGTFTSSSTNNIIPSSFSLGSGAINSDPQYLNISNNDYRVRVACAPGTNAGSSSVIPAGITTDVSGSPRVVYGTPDIGAFEFNDFTVNKSGTITADCFGVNTSVTMSGGGLSITNYQAGSTISTNNVLSLPPGSYPIRILQTGCATPFHFADLTINAPSELVFPVATFTNPKCVNSLDGTISLTATGGTAPLQFSISSANTSTTTNATGNFSGLRDDLYTCQVIDSKGCSKSQQITLVEPASLTNSTTGTDIVCLGSADGTIKVTASGGTAPYKYTLNGGSQVTTDLFVIAQAGSYTTRVIDANNCLSSTQSYYINEPDELIIDSAPKADVTCFGKNDGQLEVNASGGNQPFTYSVDGTTYLQDGVFTNLAPQTYNVRVKDVGGCLSAPFPVTIVEPTQLTFTATTTQINCFGSSSGEIVLTASGGKSPYGYSRNGVNFINQNQFGSLAPGTYPMQVIDLNGCLSAVQQIQITQPAQLVNTPAITHISCFGQTNGAIQLVGSGGTAPYTYSFEGSGFSSVNNFTGLNQGTYSSRIRDAKNCTTSTISSEVLQPTQLTVAASIVNGFEVEALATGGTAPYQYSIDGTTFQTTSLFDELINGQYTVTAKDSKNCTASAQTALIITAISEDIKIDVYPNPTTEWIVIKDLTGEEQLRMLDTNGQLLLLSPAMKGNNSIDFSSYTSGLYILNVGNFKTGESQVVKILKK